MTQAHARFHAGLDAQKVPGRVQWGSQSWLQPPLRRPDQPPESRLKDGCSQNWLPHHWTRIEASLGSLAAGLRSAQGADDGLRVTLDYGQVGTDGNLRAPPALLPVLE